MVFTVDSCIYLGVIQVIRKERLENDGAGAESRFNARSAGNPVIRAPGLAFDIGAGSKVLFRNHWDRLSARFIKIQ